jgi:hypothetical protein
LIFVCIDDDGKKNSWLNIFILEFISILAYHGSSRVLISIFCFLMVLTVATLCICAFFALKCYYHRGSYCTDHKSGKEKQILIGILLN